MILSKCKNGNWTDWGSFSCKLYNPYETNSKKRIVDYGTCEANIRCPYKMYMNKLGGEIDNGD